MAGGRATAMAVADYYSNIGFHYKIARYIGL